MWRGGLQVSQATIRSVRGFEGVSSQTDRLPVFLCDGWDSTKLTARTVLGSILGIINPTLGDTMDRPGGPGFFDIGNAYIKFCLPVPALHV